MKNRLETLVKTWDVKTIRDEIKDLKDMIADRKRDRMDYKRWANDLKVLQAELASR